MQRTVWENIHHQNLLSSLPSPLSPAGKPSANLESSAGQDNLFSELPGLAILGSIICVCVIA